MANASLTRLRWRLRGAWMWPLFIVLVALDGPLTHWLPFTGDHESLVAAWLLGFIWTLVAVAVLVPPVGWVVRRVRRDMPKVVARDYAGAGICVVASLVLLGAGLAHRHVVERDRQALQDAVARAVAYIGDHAPSKFDSPSRRLDAYAVQPPTIYRICAGRPGGPEGPYEFYCVVVNRSRPFGQGVRYDGSEPNSILSQGTS